MHQSILLSLVLGFAFRIVIAGSVEEAIEVNHQRIREVMETDLDSALLLADESLAFALQHDNAWGIGYAYYFKAYIVKEKQETSTAFIYYLKALDFLEPLKFDKAVSTRIKILTNCGNILNDHSKFDEAIEFYNRAIDLAKEYDMRERLITPYYNRGELNGKNEQYENGISDAKNSLEISRELNNEYMIISSLNLLGSINKRQEKWGLALQYYQQIIDHSYETLDSNEYKGLAYHNIADCYFSRKNYAEAENFYLKALIYKRLMKNQKYLFITCLDLTDLYDQIGELDQAREMGAEADSLYALQPLNPENYKVYEILRHIYHQTGDHELEEHYARLYQTENERFLEEQQRVMQLREQFAMDIVLAELNEQPDPDLPNQVNYWIWALAAMASVAVLLYLLRNYPFRSGLTPPSGNAPKESDR